MDLNLILGSVTTQQIIDRFNAVNDYVTLTFDLENYVIDRTYWNILKGIEAYLLTVAGSALTTVDVFNEDFDVITLDVADFESLIDDIQTEFDEKAYLTSVTLSTYLSDVSAVKKADLAAWV
ncbi:MAG: hypothetical protein V4629_03000 [Pseudomonadota bacterium]